jgi:large subunit ribosomal protein L30
MLKVTLKKSPIKSTKSQRETVKGLGLRKLNSTRLLPDTPEVRGMIGKVSHIVECEEIAD